MVFKMKKVSACGYSLFGRNAYPNMDKILFLSESLKLATDDPNDEFRFLDESLFEFIEKTANR